MMEIKKFENVYMMSDNTWAITPTGIQFKITRVKNDVYGNPMYHIEFDGKTWQKVVKVSS